MKIITKIVAVCCLWGLSSCDSYLDVNQPSIYTDQSLYKTPADCEASIAGVYSQLQTVYNRNYLEAIVLREDAIKNMNNNITRLRILLPKKPGKPHGNRSGYWYHAAIRYWTTSTG